MARSSKARARSGEGGEYVFMRKEAYESQNAGSGVNDLFFVIAW